MDHERAWEWADTELSHGWASCAITENGFVRIISQPRYPSPVSPHRAVDLLRTSRDGSDHEFWPCDVSSLDEDVLTTERIHGPRRLTDAYLLALAARYDGRFVTVDRRVGRDAVPAAEDRHLVIL
ncbi:TA system VapC family ribonuclease toxin [Actinomycetospora sp. NBRC 106378]|uniref:TA system VapC family ribonuclease toxin n=1 Tax=Actinomycetospora sp. NBRC 106378 TaxID=3032208 RepID=UPI002554FBC9|nr:TA system VapC family ribonuclease toxin [Actinomycetospora sp. NBRC 106378]